MRKLAIALGLVTTLQVGSVMVDGSVLSVTLPTGTEVSAVVTTVEPALAVARSCKGLAKAFVASDGKSFDTGRSPCSFG